MVQDAKPVHKIKQAAIEQLRSLGWNILSYPSAHISQGVEAIRVSYLPLFPVQYGGKLYSVPPELYNALPE